MEKHYKIVHCGIFNEKDNGNFFYGLERKISHGLIQNGHFVYDFSFAIYSSNSSKTLAVPTTNRLAPLPTAIS